MRRSHLLRVKDLVDPQIVSAMTSWDLALVAAARQLGMGRNNLSLRIAMMILAGRTSASIAADQSMVRESVEAIYDLGGEVLRVERVEETFDERHADPHPTEAGVDTDQVILNRRADGLSNLARTMCDYLRAEPNPCIVKGA